MMATSGMSFKYDIRVIWMNERFRSNRRDPNLLVSLTTDMIIFSWSKAFKTNYIFNKLFYKIFIKMLNSKLSILIIYYKLGFKKEKII